MVLSKSFFVPDFELLWITLFVLDENFGRANYISDPLFTLLADYISEAE